MIKILILCAAFSLFVQCSWATGVVCRDDDGNPVDWFYASKLPRNETDPNPNIAYGDAYVYLLSSHPDVTEWTLSPLGSDNATSMMGRTLSPVYTFPRSDDLAYVLYNDENPDGNTSFTLGHTKGDLVFDKDGGYWLVHSVPKYPPWADQPYGYPSSGHMYGQSFLCISIATDVVDSIGIQFQYTTPYIYNFSLPSWAQDAFPNLYAAVVEGESVNSEPFYNVVQFKSAGGIDFTSFAKHTNWGKDLYADLVAPTLQSDLYVETWNHGDDEMPSVCNQYDVFNVDEVYISPVKYSFENYYDHSKWAVAPPDAKDAPWICSGDNNRMDSQEKRGGGTVCQQSIPAWNAFTTSVTAVEPC